MTGAQMQQLKKKANGVNRVKYFFTNGVRIFGNSCKKGWYKVRHIRR